MPIPESGCWLWLLCTMNSGYGSVKHNRKMHGAHRVSYEQFNGAIPDGMHVLHTCDCKLCVNPDHLYVGTHKENMTDFRKRGQVHNKRFSQEMKKDITERYQNGETQVSLAKEFNTDFRYISVLIKSYLGDTSIRPDRNRKKIKLK